MATCWSSMGGWPIIHGRPSTVHIITSSPSSKRRESSGLQAFSGARVKAILLRTRCFLTIWIGEICSRFVQPVPIRIACRVLIPGFVSQQSSASLSAATICGSVLARSSLRCSGRSITDNGRASHSPALWVIVGQSAVLSPAVVPECHVPSLPAPTYLKLRLRHVLEEIAQQSVALSRRNSLDV